MINLNFITGIIISFIVFINYCHCDNIMNSNMEESSLDCNRRAYSHKVTQSDSEGRICWDTITVVSCWGRCDSNEISDWRFPYKRSHHPVCIHGERKPKTVILSNCDKNAEPGTEIHEFMEAVSCECSLCKSSEANCQGVRYKGDGEIFRFQRNRT